MPFLFYVFLAFLIEFYQPYIASLSNHRACYFTLVIGYGYLIRVIYLFSFRENVETDRGYTNENVWVIVLWIVLMIVALVFGVVDVVSLYREKKKEAARLQEEFRRNLEMENKLFEKKVKD